MFLANPALLGLPFVVSGGLKIEHVPLMLATVKALADTLSLNKARMAPLARFVFEPVRE